MENQMPIVPVEQPKQSNFLVVLLSVLLLLSVSIAGFFAFQTQKLVKELTLLRTEPTPIATSESVVSPELTFEQDKTLDLTANWKTYSDTKNGYSLKYPGDWLSTSAKIYPKPQCSEVKTFENKDCVDGYVTFNVYKIPDGQILETFIKNLDSSRKMDEPQIYDKKYMPNNMVEVGAVEANYMGMYGPLVAYVPRGDSVIEIYFYNIDSETINSILSTFKFTK